MKNIELIKTSLDIIEEVRNSINLISKNAIKYHLGIAIKSINQYLNFEKGWQEKEAKEGRR